MELIKEQAIGHQAKKVFTIISKGRVVSIVFDEVTHVRKFGYETIVYTLKREYRTKYSLQDIMNELPENDFFRIHKSHIVSLKFIRGIKKDKIRIGETYLLISKYYREQMITELSKQLDQLIKFHSGT